MQLDTTNRLPHIETIVISLCFAFVHGLNSMSEINVSTPKQHSEVQTMVYDECSAMASIIMNWPIITVRHTKAEGNPSHFWGFISKPLKPNGKTLNPGMNLHCKPKVPYFQKGCRYFNQQPQEQRRVTSIPPFEASIPRWEGSTDPAKNNEGCYTLVKGGGGALVSHMV